MEKTLLKKDFGQSAIMSQNQSGQIELASASVSLLEKAELLRVLPLCLGLVKSKG